MGWNEPWTPERVAWFRANPDATKDEFDRDFPSNPHSFEGWRKKRYHVLGPEKSTSRQTALPVYAPLNTTRRVEMRVDAQVVGLQTVVDDIPDELYEELFALLERVDDVTEQLSPTQENTDWYAPDDGLPVAIAFNGDWHLGSAGVDAERLDADLRLVRDTPGLYAVGMGDFVEGVNIHVKAASALYSGLLNDGNLQEMYALLRMGKAAGKWLALVSGNHDEWMRRSSGVSRVDRLAKALGERGQRPPHFCQGGGTIFAHVGNQRYVVAVTHNAKGNSRLNTTNAQRTTFDSWPEWENCDVICCGHLHYPDRHRAYRKGGFCEYLRSGTYKLRDGYAADNGFRSGYGVPLVILMPDRHHAKGWDGDDFHNGVKYLTWLRENYQTDSQ